MSNPSQLFADLTLGQLRGTFGLYLGFALVNGKRHELFDRERELSVYNAKGCVSDHGSSDVARALRAIGAELWAPDGGAVEHLNVADGDGDGDDDDDDEGVEWLERLLG